MNSYFIWFSTVYAVLRCEFESGSATVYRCLVSCRMEFWSDLTHTSLFTAIEKCKPDNVEFLVVAEVSSPQKCLLIFSGGGAGGIWRSVI